MCYTVHLTTLTIESLLSPMHSSIFMLLIAFKFKKSSFMGNLISWN